MNLWPRDIFKVLIFRIEVKDHQYFENAQGQLTSFIRLIADKESIISLIFCSRNAAHGG
jgi:hypothetical protein